MNKIKRVPTDDLIFFLEDYALHYCPTPIAKGKIAEACRQLKEAQEALSGLITDVISLKNQLDACAKERDAALLACKELREHFQLRNQ